MELIKTDEFNIIYKDMLAQFPKSELKSYEKFLKLFGENYILYKVVDGEFAGYIILFEYGDFIFIDYIAVLKQFHSKGLGRKILSLLKDIYPEKKGCFLEVEPPDISNPDTIRRINFYTKNGAQQLHVNYLYPNEQGCIPLDLYYIKYKDLPSDEDIRVFITELFKQVHGDLAHSMEVWQKIFC